MGLVPEVFRLVRNYATFFNMRGLFTLMHKSLIPVLALALVSGAGCKPKKPAVPPSLLPEAPAATSPDAGSSGTNRPAGQPGATVDAAQRANERFDQMKTALGLSEEQAQKARAIIDQQSASMQAMRSDQSLSREQRQEKMTESRNAVASQIGAILTPEQKPKWEELQKKREAERAERRANRPQQGAGARPPQT